jgi:Uncharacterized conserved protein
VSLSALPIRVLAPSSLLQLTRTCCPAGAGRSSWSALIRGYQRRLTRFTPACPQTPSCSAYALDAVRTLGPRRGIRAAAARIRACGPKGPGLAPLGEPGDQEQRIRRSRATFHRIEPPISVEQGSTTMAGKFEIYAGKDGKYRFRLKAGNGEVVATGQGYSSKAAAKKGVEAVQKAAAGATIVELAQAES